MKDDPDTNVQFVKMIEQNPCVYNRKCRSYSNKAVQDEAWEKIGREFDATVAECKERWKNLRACFTRDLKLKSTPGYCAANKKPYYLAQHLNFLRPFTKSRSQFGRILKAPSDSLKHESRHHLDEKESFQENLSETNNDSTLNTDDVIDADSSDTNLTQNNDKQLLNSNLMKSTSSPTRPRRWIDLKDRKTKTNIFKLLSKRRKPNAIQIDNDLDDLDLCFFKSLLPDIRQMNADQKRRFKIGVINLSGAILNEENSFEKTSFACYRDVKKEKENFTIPSETRKSNHESGGLSQSTKNIIFPVMIPKQGNEHLEQDETLSTTNNHGFVGSHDIESRPGSVQSTLSSGSSIIECKVATEDLDHLMYPDVRNT